MNIQNRFRTILSVMLAFCLLFGGANAGATGESAVQDQGAASDADKAKTLYDAVASLYSIKGSHLYREHYPEDPDDRPASYLWALTEMFSALNALGELPEYREDYLKLLPGMLESVSQYWDETRTPPAYQAYPAAYGQDDRFYDDNLWLGLDFVDAYRITSDSSYLDRAEEIFAFALGGWSDELGGGIFWNEQTRETRNACSNGPASVLALELYTLTGDSDYLEWGRKIYEWTRANLQAPDGLYWDNIDESGAVEKTCYAYNCGTMIQAAVLLHSITGERAYLAEAQRVAKASYDYFAPSVSSGIRFFPGKDPWFTVVLFRGYYALYEADGDPTYMKAMEENLACAWEHARDAEGLLSPDWSGRSDADASGKSLLDEICMVEVYAILAQWKGGNAN